MDEAEILCDEIIIMDHGKIIEQGAPADLLKKHFGEAVIKVPEGSFATHDQLSCPTEKHGGYVTIRCKDMDGTIRELMDKGISLNGLTVERQNLDDLFLKLTGSSLD
jgi:ABC-2 type transport system ATP-binding protein